MLLGPAAETKSKSHPIRDRRQDETAKHQTHVHTECDMACSMQHGTH